MAIEAKSLRSSNGTVIWPVPVDSPGAKVSVASAMRRPLSSKAPAVTWRGAGSPGARMAERAKPATSFSASGQAGQRSRSGRAQTRRAAFFEQQRVEGGVVALRGQPVGEHGDDWRPAGWSRAAATRA